MAHVAAVAPGLARAKPMDVPQPVLDSKSPCAQDQVVA
jgi:hypothetical protein